METRQAHVTRGLAQGRRATVLSGPGKANPGLGRTLDQYAVDARSVYPGAALVSVVVARFMNPTYGSGSNQSAIGATLLHSTYGYLPTSPDDDWIIRASAATDHIAQAAQPTSLCPAICSLGMNANTYTTYLRVYC